MASPAALDPDCLSNLAASHPRDKQVREKPVADVGGVGVDGDLHASPPPLRKERHSHPCPHPDRRGASKPAR